MKSILEQRSFLDEHFCHKLYRKFKNIDVTSCLFSLEKNGYISLETTKVGISDKHRTFSDGHNEMAIVSITVTEKGLIYDKLQGRETFKFVISSIIIPILVSVSSSVLTLLLSNWITS